MDFFKTLHRLRLLVVLVLFSLPLGVFAGNIIPGKTDAQWLRGDLGKVNFGTVQGDVTVSDSAVTGHAWGEDVGWINLNPANAGVLNDGEGNLTGYAWGENTGWVNFNPTQGGVVITKIAENVGEFSGYAWSQNFGWLSFNCSDEGVCGSNDYKVHTTWTPASEPAEEDDPPPGGGGGPGPGDDDPPPSDDPPPTDPPDGEDPPDTEGPDDPPGGPGDGPDDGPDSGSESTPFIELFGQNVIELTEGEVFSEPGYRAIDRIDGDITHLVEVTGFVDSNVPGVYELRYSVTNSTENTYTVVRRVTIRDDSIVPPEVDITDTVVGTWFGTVQDFVRSPAGSISTKTISTLGLLAGLFVVLSTLFANPLTFAELFFIPFRVGSLLSMLFGFRRRYKAWGVVYDSITKQPLDPAHVTLMDIDGNDIDSVLTDLDGRYGFLAEPGVYRLRAEKTHYQFPSTVLEGQKKDEVYPDLYFGEIVEVTEGGVINKNIPMDPLGFDWNEFAKRDKKLMHFYSKYDRVLLHIIDFLFYVGFTISVIALFFAPEPYNYIIFGLYIVLIIIRLIGVSPRSYGKILDVQTGDPLSYALIRVLTADNGNLILKTTADKYGRYFALISNGEYIIEIDEKIGNDEYNTIFTSRPVRITEGIIKRTFKI